MPARRRGCGSVGVGVGVGVRFGVGVGVGFGYGIRFGVGVGVGVGFGVRFGVGFGYGFGVVACDLGTRRAGRHGCAPRIRFAFSHRERAVIDRRLQVFHAVAELESFTRAAKRLHMTQPAVTFQVRQLEQHFNTRLFDREHNRIELTVAGRRVDQYAKRILALYGEMDGALRELTDDMAGTLMLGASMTIAEYDLPRLLVRFKEMFPQVNVKLLMSNTDGIVQMVIENRIDLGLVEGPVHNRSLTVRRYDVDRLVIALRPGHPLAGEDRVPLEALRGVPLILREEGSGTREVFLEHARAAGFEIEDFDVSMELGSPEAIKGAVAAGLGITIISVATLRKEIELGTLCAVELDPPIERPFSFVHQNQMFRVPAVEALVRFATADASG